MTSFNLPAFNSSNWTSGTRTKMSNGIVTFRGGTPVQNSITSQESFTFSDGITYSFKVKIIDFKDITGSGSFQFFVGGVGVVSAVPATELKIGNFEFKATGNGTTTTFSIRSLGLYIDFKQVEVFESKLFGQHSVEDQADSIAAYLPSGELFKSARISDSNFRKLLLGIANELFNAEGYLKLVADEYDIRTTNLFIEEWESALGIPDSCFKGTGDIIERRAHVLIKLIARGTQTIEDFVEMGNLLGLDLTVVPGVEFITFPLTFPILMFETNRHARFTIVIKDVAATGSVFPLQLPFRLGPSSSGTLNCFLQKLKPANVNLLFIQ